ncbi:hypothetical protein, partial [Kocuria marina]|uniref:hypothetical protein n=1 Tax=Kocuria marina TaxID=223184 RepID=UPI001C92F85C
SPPADTGRGARPLPMLICEGPHNGHNRDQGVFVGVDEDAQRVITVHTLGRRAFTADKVAARLGKAFFT